MNKYSCRGKSLKFFFITQFVLLSSISIFSQVGINTENPLGILHIDGKKDPTTINPSTGFPSSLEVSDDVIVTTGGRVGLGKIDPVTKLDMRGGINIENPSAQEHYILMSDASGNATWTNPSITGFYFMDLASKSYFVEENTAIYIPGGSASYYGDGNVNGMGASRNSFTLNAPGLYIFAINYAYTKDPNSSESENPGFDDFDPIYGEIWAGLMPETASTVISNVTKFLMKIPVSGAASGFSALYHKTSTDAEKTVLFYVLRNPKEMTYFKTLSGPELIKGGINQEVIYLSRAK